MSDMEIDENSLEYAKSFKKRLRFDVGKTVFLISDTKRKCPMTIKKILIFDEDSDYVLCWATSQKTIESNFFSDKTLMA